MIAAFVLRDRILVVNFNHFTYKKVRKCRIILKCTPLNEDTDVLLAVGIRPTNIRTRVSRNQQILRRWPQEMRIRVPSFLVGLHHPRPRREHNGGGNAKRRSRPGAIWRMMG